jgi:hypothetical protein
MTAPVLIVLRAPAHGTAGTSVDVVIDGRKFRSLSVIRDRVTWPSTVMLPPSVRAHAEPRILQAVRQWADLVGGEP